jgi:hypothetical protein
MNTIIDEFAAVYVDFDDAILARHEPSEPNEPGPASTPIPVETKALSGYDLIMRRHASACEAGR